MANLTISLDENLVKQARIKAIQEGTSLSAKVREMLAAGMDLPVEFARPEVAKILMGYYQSEAAGG